MKYNINDLGKIVDDNLLLDEYETTVIKFCLPLSKIVKLEWRDINEYNGGYLTLREIAEQCNTVGTLKVIYESALWGVIFEYNNYADRKWRVHGITRGYA